MSDHEISTNLARFSGFATGALHAGQEPEQWKSRAVIPPISMSTTFKQVLFNTFIARLYLKMTKKSVKIKENNRPPLWAE